MREAIFCNKHRKYRSHLKSGEQSAATNKKHSSLHCWASETYTVFTDAQTLTRKPWKSLNDNQRVDAGTAAKFKKQGNADVLELMDKQHIPRCGQCNEQYLSVTIYCSCGNNDPTSNMNTNRKSKNRHLKLSRNLRISVIHVGRRVRSEASEAEAQSDRKIDTKPANIANEPSTESKELDGFSQVIYHRFRRQMVQRLPISAMCPMPYESRYWNIGRVGESTKSSKQETRHYKNGYEIFGHAARFLLLASSVLLF